MRFREIKEGMKVVLNRPKTEKGRQLFPHWVKDMDKYNGKIFIVSQKMNNFSRLSKIPNLVSLSGIPFKANPRWLTKAK